MYTLRDGSVLCDYIVRDVDYLLSDTTYTSYSLFYFYYFELLFNEFSISLPTGSFFFFFLLFFPPPPPSSFQIFLASIHFLSFMEEREQCFFYFFVSSFLFNNTDPRSS